MVAVATVDDDRRSGAVDRPVEVGPEGVAPDVRGERLRVARHEGVLA